MNVFEYFKKQEIDTVGRSFYSLIELWSGWYHGDVKSFHHYSVYNGENKIKRTRKSLGMAKKVCEDVADLLLNERVKISISDETTQKYVDEVLKDNNFMVMGNEYQERKAATGTVAYVPYMDNAEVSEDGSIMRADISINYVEAKNIFPISWQNRRVKEVIFLFPQMVNKKKYALFQYHKIITVGGIKQYVISNEVVECTKGTGRKLEYEEWSTLSAFANVAERIETGSDKPQFVIDSLNIVNNSDDDDTNPMGIPIFANSIAILKKLDLEYDSYANEFELGRKRLFVKSEALNFMNGEPVFDPNDVVFYKLPEESGNGKSGNAIEESNMTIRAEEHSKAINDDLNFLSLKCGFGTNRYRFDSSGIATATQVISENSDMYRVIKKHEIVLDSVIKELVSIIIRLGIASSTPGLSESVEISIDFDDSIIEDKEAELNRNLRLLSAGILRSEEVRSKAVGETIDEALKNLPEQNGVIDDEVKIAQKTAEIQGGQKSKVSS